MPTLFVGNFEFEHRLNSGHGDLLPESVRRINEELAAVWLAVAQDGDFLWTPAPVDDRFFETLASCGLPRVQPVCEERHIQQPVTVCPWGWTVAVRQWAESHNWHSDAPPPSAVREVNSRRFSSRLEREWGVGLHGAVEVHSLDELSRAIQKRPPATDNWIVKAEFGMSAREQMRAQGRSLPKQVANWARKRLARNGRVFFEPGVERIEEAGLQFTVPRSGRPVLEGITPLLSASTGEYRGSRFAPDAEVERRWTSAVEVGMTAAERAQQTGYFGPLGIDAMRYRPLTPHPSWKAADGIGGFTGAGGEGDLRLRPLQDINARWTMGRLSLGFRRLLKPGEVGTWLHLPSAKRGVLNSKFRTPHSPLRCIVTSPDQVAGRRVQHITILVIAPSPELLERAEAILRA